MRKTFKFKRWMAFLLAFILTATTCMSSADAFLWATDTNVEDTAAQPEETKPVEETQVVDLSNPPPSDSNGADDVQAPVEEETPEQEQVQAPQEESAGEPQDGETADETQQTEPGADLPGDDDVTTPAGDDVTEEPKDPETQAPEGEEDSDKISGSSEETADTYSYTIAYFYDDVEDEEARVTKDDGVLGDKILTIEVEEEVTLPDGARYELKEIVNEDGVITEDGDNKVEIYYESVEGDEDEEADEEETPDDKMPAQTLTGYADGVKITVDAAEGILPEGTTVEVASVGVEEVQDAINMALEPENLTAVEINAVDITLKKDGESVRPAGSVSVKLENLFSADGHGTVARVYHVSGSSASAVGSADASATNVEFATDHFSVYAGVKAVSGSVMTLEEPGEIKATYTMRVGDTRKLDAETGQRTKDHEYEVDAGKDVVKVTKSNDDDADVEALAVGEALVKHTYKRGRKQIEEWFKIIVTDEYTITYDINGGGGTTPASVQAKTGEPITLPTGEGISRSNYRLLGWSTQKDANTVNEHGDKITIYSLGGEYVVSGDQTLYAVWAKVEGATTGKITIGLRKDGTIPDEPSIQNAEYVYLVRGESVDDVLKYFSPAHTVSGVDNVKSALQPAFYDKVESANANGSFWDPDTQYVEWYVIKYQGNDKAWHIDGVVRNRDKVNLDYNGNGNTAGLAPDGKQYDKGTEVKVSDKATLEKTGYDFKGWNTADDGTGTSYQPEDIITLQESVTLYAQWEPKNSTEYKVEHWQQQLDGTYRKAEEESKKGRTNSKVTANPKNYTGYVYNPNHLDSKAEGVIRADGSLVLKLYYDRATYTVTYDLDGGSSSEQLVYLDLKYGKDTPKLSADPTKEGYAFKGWTPEIAEVVEEDVTYTAQWKMNVREKDIAVESYIGTYDAEGHTVKVDKAELEEGDRVWYSTDDGATWTNEDKTTKFTNVVKDQRVRVKVTNPKYIVDAEAEGTVTITPFEITVKAEDASKTYGDRDPEEFKVEITPKEKPDDYTIGYEEPGREAGENAGFYEIKVTGEQYQNNGNYIVTYVPGTFTINAAERAKKISVESYAGTYDAAGHTVTVNNTEQGDVVQYSLDEGANWVTEDKAKFKDVTYAGADSEEIVPKSVWVKVSNPNYGDDVVVKDGTVTITRKQVTVTAQAAPVSKVYGQEIEPKLSGETSGVIGAAEFVYEVSREEGEAVGTYAVTASGDRIQGNYEVEYVSGTFTITPADRAELNVEPYSGTYDAKKHSIEVSGLLPGDSVTYSWQDESDKWSEPSDELPQFTDVTNRPIQVKVQVTNSNYSYVPEVCGTVNITPFAVKVKAEDASKIYGEDDPEFEAKVISAEAEKNKPADGYTISYNVSREKGEDVGGYTITPSGDSEQGNYIVTYETGRFTINAAQRAKEISVESYAGTYDAAGHTVTVKNTEVGDVVEYSLNGGETWVSKDEAQLTDKCNAARIHVKVTNANYGDPVVITNGTVTITPFEITVKAKDAEKKYGEKDPKFEVVVSPAEAGKNKPEDGYEIRCTEISREEGENVGKYTITPKVDYEQGNYIVTYEPATFTITPADRAELNVESYSGIYDAEEHSIKVIGLLTGDSVTYSWQDESGIWSEPSDELPQFTNVTNGPILVKVQVTNSNYSDVPEVQGTVNITPFAVKVKAEDASKIYGAQDPEFKAEVFSVEAGKNKPEDGYTIRYKEISREEGEDVGEYTITPSGDLEQGNYIVTYETGTFTIQAADRENAVTVTSYEGVYDAAGHTVTVNNTVEGDVVEYSLDGGASWVPENEAKLTNVVDARSIQVRVTNANYGDPVVITNGTVTITPAIITVTADSKSKKYGETDPIFTYTHSNGVAEEIPVFDGGLVRIEGENVTVTGYEINQGTLSLADNPETGFKADNYMIIYVPAALIISDESVTNNDVVTKTHAAGTYEVGDRIEFTITVTNIYDTVQTITIKELETVTFEGFGEDVHSVVFNDVEAGGTRTIKAYYTVTEADAYSGTYQNKVEVAFSNGKGYENTDTVTLEKLYRLSVYHLYRNGATAADTMVRYLKAEEGYTHRPPRIAGYRRSTAFITGTMPEKDLDLIVYYTAVETTTDPTPTPTPDPDPTPTPTPDPDPTPTPPTPDPTPTPTPIVEETVPGVPPVPPTPAAVPAGAAPAVVPAGAVPVEAADPGLVAIDDEEVPLAGTLIGEDEDGNITLTPITEEEIPLANRDLDDHKCCALSFLLMLATLIIYTCFTHSMKKRQEKLAELKDQLAEETLKRRLGITNDRKSRM